MAEHSFDNLVPARKAELQAAERPVGAVPPISAAPVAPEPVPAVLAAPAPVSEPAAPEAAPTSPPVPGVDVPRFVEGRGKIRSLTIDLDYPIEFAGRVFETITLRRPTSAEVGEFFERLVELRAIDENASLPFPIFVDEDGQPIPDPVLGFLDGADDEAVMQASADFLPPRLQRLRAAQ